MRVVLHPEADAEARSAAFWYEQQRPGLGDEFLVEISAVPHRIEVGRRSFPRWPGVSETAEPVRMAVLRRFPYLVAFRGIRGQFHNSGEFRADEFGSAHGHQAPSQRCPERK